MRAVRFCHRRVSLNISDLRLNGFALDIQFGKSCLKFRKRALLGFWMHCDLSA